ncbi:MAG: hypothetical protein KAX11_02785 [Candidatus Aminicenantes bacterium]|nr:hypothetical protein [Candidatus Aminicenantes bacterium]
MNGKTQVRWEECPLHETFLPFCVPEEDHLAPLGRDTKHGMNAEREWREKPLSLKLLYQIIAKDFIFVWSKALGG